MELVICSGYSEEAPPCTPKKHCCRPHPCLNLFGFHGPGGRAEDSRSRGPEFESQRWANFQRLWRIFKIGIHMQLKLQQLWQTTKIEDAKHLPLTTPYP